VSQQQVPLPLGTHLTAANALVEINATTIKAISFFMTAPLNKFDTDYTKLIQGKS